jgi:hypothetical protein
MAPVAVMADARKLRLFMWYTNDDINCIYNYNSICVQKQFKKLKLQFAALIF